MGANIGTTATALIVMYNMDLAAKKTALSHFLFNIGGVALFLPVFLAFGDRLNAVDMNPAVALANIHLVFNLVSCLFFLALIRPFIRLVETLLGEGKMDFQRIEMPHYDADIPFAEQKDKLESNLLELLACLQENYNLVTLSIESNYRSVYEASARRLEYIAFLERDVQACFSQFLAETTDEDESRQLVDTFTRYDYLSEVHDSIEDIFTTKQTMDANFIELRSDGLVMIREISSQTLALFDAVYSGLAAGQKPDVHDRVAELRATTDELNRKLLRLMRDPERRDVGSLSQFITYSRRLRDKLLRFSKLAGRSLAEQRPAPQSESPSSHPAEDLPQPDGVA
jgi:phosphate:Na+ symporter